MAYAKPPEYDSSRSHWREGKYVGWGLLYFMTAETQCFGIQMPAVFAVQFHGSYVLLDTASGVCIV